MGASETKHMPSSNAEQTSAAICKARHVLPTPPGPVTVNKRTSGCSRRAQSAPTSCSRPIKGVRGVGKGWTAPNREERRRCAPSSEGERRCRALFSSITYRPCAGGSYALLYRAFINLPFMVKGYMFSLHSTFAVVSQGKGSFCLQKHKAGSTVLSTPPPAVHSLGTGA